MENIAKIVSDFFASLKSIINSFLGFFNLPTLK